MKYFKKNGFLICLFLITGLYAQDFEWAKSFGGTSPVGSQTIAVDSLGYIYTLGDFQGTVDFDPGPGITNLTAAGNYDIFIQKTDSSGNLVWAKSFGGSSSDQIQIQSINIDHLGNIYTTGFLHGTADFDPGPGTFNLTSAGFRDVFVHKIDSSGNFLWAKSFGGVSFDESYSICSDDLGNVYTIGIFQGTVDFDPGSGTFNLTSIGFRDVFIQKLDSSGNFLWAKSFKGNSGKSITIDQLGNIYTFGTFSGTVDFDPGPGITNLTAVGNHDLYIQKLDSSGHFIWIKSFGGTDIKGAESITIDHLGHIYATGHFKSTVDFDPGPGTFNLTAIGNYDVFVLKIDTLGNFLWAKSFGGTLLDSGKSIHNDVWGNVYTIGVFDGTVDFDPGPGTYNITTPLAGFDVFIQKMDASGNFVWATSFNYSSIRSDRLISLDHLGYIYTTGYFYGTVDFDPGPGTYNITSLGDRDAFIHKIGQCFTTSSIDTINACDTYTWIDGNTYTTSNNTATHTLTNSEGCDSVIILDLTINSNSSIDIQETCDSLTWIDGNTYTTSNNTATHTLTNVLGCDSIITLNLTVNTFSTHIDIQETCDSLTWIDGNTYTASNNTATYTLTNYLGCDSIVTLDLTINNSSTSIDNQETCDSLIWIDGNTYTTSNNTATHTLTNTTGCDSVVMLNLTINSSSSIDIQEACNSLTWIDGNTYTESNNTITHTLSNAAGCDSVITLYLTINNVSDITTSLSNQTITATNTNASYQWLDCNNGNAVIPTETNQTFTASSNGSYAVELTENGCIDTSNCVVIESVNIVENSSDDKIVIYPNPTHGKFSVNLGESHSDINVRITDLNGRLIQSTNYKNTQFLNLTITEPTGIYLMFLESKKQKMIIKLVNL